MPVTNVARQPAGQAAPSSLQGSRLPRVQPGSYRDQAAAAGCHPMWQSEVRQSMEWPPRCPTIRRTSASTPVRATATSCCTGAKLKSLGRPPWGNMDVAEGGEQGVAEEREEGAGFRDGCRTEV